jgi:hypothetical protein
MVTAYRNIRGKLKVSGTEGDPVFVVVEGISVTNFNTNAAVTNVVDATKTTILTQAYVATTFENLVLVSVSGSYFAKYYLTLNGTDIDIRRSSPDRNLQFDFTGAPLELVPGDTVDIKVEHFDTGTLHDFEATIYGYD